MKTVFSVNFVERVQELGPETREQLQQVVARIIENPNDFDHPNLMLGGGCVEKKSPGGVRIVYCVCGKCREAKEPHEDCEGGANREAYPDDTLLFRTIYVAF